MRLKWAEDSYCVSISSKKVLFLYNWQIGYMTWRLPSIFLSVGLAVTILPIPISILMPLIMPGSSCVKAEAVFRLYQPLRSSTISSSKGFCSLQGLIFPPPVTLLGQFPTLFANITLLHLFLWSFFILFF